MSGTYRNFSVVDLSLRYRTTVPQPCVQPDDLALLGRVRQGDQNAMGELFDRHSRAVYSVARHVLKDDGYAEDVMQEIFLQIWQNSSSFVPARGSLRPWLVAVTRNRAIDVLRRRKPTDSTEEIVLASLGNLASEAEHNIMFEKVLKALKTLPEEQRQSMYLSFFEEMTHAQIAVRIGQPLGTIKTRIRLALIRLRKVLAA